MLPSACIQYLNMMLKLCIIANVYISFVVVARRVAFFFSRALSLSFLVAASASLGHTRFVDDIFPTIGCMFFIAFFSCVSLLIECACERYGSMATKSRMQKRVHHTAHIYTNEAIKIERRISENVCFALVHLYKIDYCPYACTNGKITTAK